MLNSSPPPPLPLPLRPARIASLCLCTCRRRRPRRRAAVAELGLLASARHWKNHTCQSGSREQRKTQETHSIIPDATTLPRNARDACRFMRGHIPKSWASLLSPRASYLETILHRSPIPVRGGGVPPRRGAARGDAAKFPGSEGRALGLMVEGWSENG